MELKFSKINGTNAYLDYDLLKKSIFEKLKNTCREAEVIVLNNFPVAVSPQANIDFIILLNIPDKNRSWYKVKKGDDNIYIKNQIIAVSVFDEYANSSISIDNHLIEIDGALLDFNDIASKMKWGLTNYLSTYCNIERKFITVHPLIWIKNSSTHLISDNTFIAENITYNDIEEVIKPNYYFKWPGHKEWSNSEVVFEVEIKNIFEQASKDSEDGFITKKKIDRIQRKFGVNQDKANKAIGSKLVEVKGKAGSGKTAELLKWMLQNSLDGKRGMFLTYNHLLVYDIARQVKSFRNRQSDDVMMASTTTYTIHGYFYNVAKKLGVLLLMTESRIRELTSILDNRLVEIEAFFNSQRKPNDTSLSWLKMKVQNYWQVQQGIKREAILFIQAIEKRTYLPDQKKTSSLFKDYRNNKIKRLADLESSNIFLKDYEEVLRRIHQATTDLVGFLKDLDVESKYDLLHITMDLKPKILNKDRSGKIDFEKLKTRYKKSISGFRAGRVAYVDEAQDCHSYERDILFNLFDSNNCVIANGDKEQLIRYSELCNWHISQNKNLKYHIYTKEGKSYRMKPAIADLANHIASWYNIDLNIESLNTEDHGQIFISTSKSINEQVSILERLYKIGSRQGCNSYESLLLLKNASSVENSEKANNESVEKSSNKAVKINEFNNITDDNSEFRASWDFIQVAEDRIPDVSFWNTTGNVDKRELPVPSSLSFRSIYYESCRGIEAWSVMCFDLDSFFKDKKNEKEADNYLLNDLFDQLTSEKRKEMYAATWVLMAITRCIENCYIEINDFESSISKAILDFKEKYPHYISNI